MEPIRLEDIDLGDVDLTSLSEATSSASLNRSPKKNWVENAGGLDPYHRKIARAIHEKRGIPLSEAIKFALGRLKRWAAGGDGVTAKTKALSAKAVAHWEAIRGKNKLSEALLAEGVAQTDALALIEAPAVDLTDLPDVELLEAVADSDPLGYVLEDDEVAGLTLTEAATPAPVADLKRKPGESLGDFGTRLKQKDKALANAQDAKKKTRSGANADFEDKHPRSRGGSWTFKRGASGDEVRAIQRRVGAKTDGKGGKDSDKAGAFGSSTTEAVKRFQKANGLQVDGVVGAQTATALLGGKSAAKVAVGKMSDEQKKKLAERGKKERGGKLSEAATASDNSKAGPEGKNPRVTCPKCDRSGAPTKDAKCANCGADLSKQLDQAKKMRGKADD